MNKYQNGKIYKIVDVGYNKCYIGSTCEELSQRMARHRRHYKQFLGKQKGHIRSCNLFDEYGIENCKIQLIEMYPCNSKMELMKREGEHIKDTNCVNKIIAGRTRQERREDNSERDSALRKAHYQANKQIIAETRRQFRINNRDRLNEKDRNRYEQNREQILAQQAQKVTCICGVIHCKKNKARHERSKKHQQYMEQMREQEEEK